MAPSSTITGTKRKELLLSPRISAVQPALIRIVPVPTTVVL